MHTPLSMSNSKRNEATTITRSVELFHLLEDFITRERAHHRESPVWWQVMKDAEASIGGLLSGEQALEEFRSEYMRSTGAGASRLSMTSLVNWAMDRSIRGGPMETVADLERYVASPTMPVRFSIGVRGVIVDSPLTLSEGIELLPRSDDVSSFEPRGQAPNSTAVLTALVDFPRISAPANAPATPKHDPAAAASTAAFERLHLARFSIAIALHSRVVPTVSTALPIPSVPSSGSRSGSSVSQAPNVPLRPFRSGEMEFLRDFHARVVALPRSLRARLSVALHRWHDSFLHSGMGADVFIDLGIGFESVFVSDKAPEIRYRLALRGARLLGGETVESRARMRRILETLYDLRSEAVHQGRIVGKIPPVVAPSAGHLAMDGEELLRRAIIAMVYRGRDDWHELELG